MRIVIPFRDQFRDSMVQSLKTATTRTKAYGSRGDQFEVFGVPFVLLSVTRLPLFEVAEKWYEAEGFGNPQQFIEVWKKIHPKKGYEPKQIVYLHRFIRRNLLLATSEWPGHNIPKEDVIKW